MMRRICVVVVGLILLAWMGGVFAAIPGGSIGGTPLSDRSALPPDCLPQPGIPNGKTISFELKNSRIFPNTHRNISVYIPAAYKGDKPACVFVCFDGIAYAAGIVFDNLIAKNEMPVTIAIGIQAGKVESAATPANPRIARSFEFDSPTDRMARFILEEVLPEVEKRKTPDGKVIRLSTNPDDRAIGGGSSGGIAAFNVAWRRPDAFHRVFSSIGTYVGMRGGERTYLFVRRTETKPLRIFLEDGDHDQQSEVGDWWMANQTLERALSYAGYEVTHSWGTGGHNNDHATQIFPDAMRWLWKDYPQPVEAKPIRGNMTLKAILQPNEGWKAIGDCDSEDSHLATDPQGTTYFQNHGKTFKISPEGRIEESMAGPVFAVGGDGKLYGPEAMVGLPARDAIVRNNGDIYLTTDGNELWRVQPDGNKTKLDENLKCPRGITFTPDGLWLLVGQGQSRWGVSYRVLKDGTLDSKEACFDFCVPDWADDSDARAICTDREGRSYTATRLGIQVLDRNGRVKGILPLPGNGAATDICFGGAQFDTLIVISGGKIYTRKVRIPGAMPWAAPIELPQAPV